MAFDPKNITLIGPISPHRRLPKELTVPVTEFAAQIGKVIWAWNYCHASFSRLFFMLVSQQNFAIGRALWNTIQNDSIQRDLLWAVAQVVLANNHRMLKRLDWAKRSADTLSKIRNDAAHMATAFANYPNDPSIVPDSLSTAPKRFRRLKNQDLHKLFFDLYGDLVALSGYVAALNTAIAFPGRYALPRRPILRSTPNQASKKTSHRKSTKRPRQPRSSRA